MELCEKCLEDAVEKSATEDRWGVKLCGSCATSEDEAAYERSLSDYYGGESMTLTERYRVEAAIKRSQR